MMDSGNSLVASSDWSVLAMSLARNLNLLALGEEVAVGWAVTSGLLASWVD